MATRHYREAAAVLDHASGIWETAVWDERGCEPEAEHIASCRVGTMETILYCRLQPFLDQHRAQHVFEFKVVEQLHHLQRGLSDFWAVEEGQPLRRSSAWPPPGYQKLRRVGHGLQVVGGHTRLPGG